MSSTITVKVATLTSTVTSAKTDAATAELARYIRQEAQKNRARELRALQASIDDTAASETAL